ncbi:phage holin family protein [Chthonobacter albigriseus]|uniref:phage holin family protein n=1 Tax=Chthonobacter albigriseus TaxID=1683161 RepID=UPI0015EF519B|nr:phage holin family protein [Chthonobacter albigriseus]
MRSEDIARQLRVLWRADRIIADIHIRVALVRAGLATLALSILMFGLVMLGIAAYLVLSAWVGPTLAAALTGLAAVVIALVVFWVSTGIQPGRDLVLAQELHATAAEALAAEAKGLEADARGLLKAVRNPLDGALPGLIVPLGGIILKALKSRGEKKAG